MTIVIIIILLLISRFNIVNSLVLYRSPSIIHGRRRLDHIHKEGDGVYWGEVVINKTPFSVIMDTGSSLLALPCNDCHNCGSDKHSLFPSPSLSSSFRTEKRKKFRQCYAEGSCLYGWWLTDTTVCIDDKCTKMGLGCSSSYPPLFSEQEADGIMGLSRRSSFFNSPLVDSFSISFKEEGGELEINGREEEGVKFDIVDKDGLYYIKPSKVNGRPSAEEILIDTGTSYSLLESQIYNQMHPDAGLVLETKDGTKVKFSSDSLNPYSRTIIGASSLVGYKLTFDLKENTVIFSQLKGSS